MEKLKKLKHRNIFLNEATGCGDGFFKKTLLFLLN